MDRHYFIVHAAAECFLLIALAVRPSPYRWLIFPFTAGLNLYCYFLTPTDDPMTNQGLRVFVAANIFLASDFILLTDVQRELCLVGQPLELISNASIGSRLKWAFQLFAAVRGVGWAHEPKSVLPPHPKPPRRQFIISRLAWLGACLFMNDASSILMRANPLFATNAPPFSEQPLLHRFRGTFLYVVVGAISVDIPYTLLGLFAVGSGISQPDVWPHIMGNVLDAYTVGRFWGRTWHQMLRRTVSSHGKFLAHRVFKFRQGGTLSSCTQLYTAFLISGLIHGSSSSTSALHFFLSQAVAITFEAIVIALAARAGLKHSNLFLRSAGYIWVYCWFAYSLAPWIDFQVSAGVFEHGGMKLSLILGLYRGEWFPER